MKRLIKACLKPFWKLTGPIRRPIARRIDARIQRIVGIAVRVEATEAIRESNAAVFRIEDQLRSLNSHHDRFTTELDLVLNSLVREITRVQHQIELLGHTIEDSEFSRSRLHLLSDDLPESRVG